MQLAITILLDGLSYASYLFIVSVGLTIVFGVLKVLTRISQMIGNFHPTSP